MQFYSNRSKIEGGKKKKKNRKETEWERRAVDMLREAMTDTGR